MNRIRSFLIATEEIAQITPVLWRKCGDYPCFMQFRSAAFGVWFSKLHNDDNLMIHNMMYTQHNMIYGRRSSPLCGCGTSARGGSSPPSSCPPCPWQRALRPAPQKHADIIVIVIVTVIVIVIVIVSRHSLKRTVVSIEACENRPNIDATHLK
jgi:hypothetical protein